MTSPLCCNDLRTTLQRQVDQLPDCRQGQKTRSRIQDAAFGALGIFFPHSLSLLASQRRLQNSKGRNNAQTLCGVEKIPGDHPIRTLLDPIPPSHFDPVCVQVFPRLEQGPLVDRFRVLGDQLLVALDGTQYVSSQAIQCQNGLTRQLSNGHTRYYHAAITPVGVCPGRSEVLAVPPEYIMPQDGHAKQDCEQVASQRWIQQHAEALAPPQVPLLGDDLYSQQPFCALARHQGFNVILVCKPDSPPKFYERLALWQAPDGIAACARRCWTGRFTEGTQYRFITDVLLPAGPHALSVHWCEVTVVNPKTGAQLDHQSFITNPRVTAEHVAAVAQAGRGRWKIDNENTNVLKTQGYHLEHNFGHGKQYLAAVMLSLNLLALLFHTVLEWSDDKYALRRRVLARRQTFFADLRAFTRSLIFASWDHLIDFMLRGLELQPQCDTT